MTHSYISISWWRCPLPLHKEEQDLLNVFFFSWEEQFLVVKYFYLFLLVVRPSRSLFSPPRLSWQINCKFSSILHSLFHHIILLHSAFLSEAEHENLKRKENVQPQSVNWKHTTHPIKAPADLRLMPYHQTLHRFDSHLTITSCLTSKLSVKLANILLKLCCLGSCLLFEI